MKLDVGLDVRFDEAIAWAGKRRAVLPEEFYSDVQTAVRSGAFTVSRLTSVQEINNVLTTLNQALAEGKSMREWRKDLTGEALMLSPSHRETIFRNAIQSSYSAGRWMQHVENKAIRPILMYDAINDSRTRPNHRALDNFMAPVDDPIWRRIYPPNGHNCRCTVISLTEKQARARGWLGYVRTLPAEPDEGWDHHPAIDYQEVIDAENRRELAKSPLQIIRAGQSQEILEVGRRMGRDWVLTRPDSDVREYAVAINPRTGLIDATWTGDRSSVAIPDTDVNRRAITGSVFIHNHPNSSALSLADYKVSAYYSVKEMHAVGQDGAWYVGSAPRVSQAEMAVYVEDLDRLHAGIEVGLHEVLMPLFKQKALTAEEANQVHWHLYSEALAAAGVVRYEVRVTGENLGKAMRKAGGLFDVEALKARLKIRAREVRLRGTYAYDN